MAAAGAVAGAEFGAVAGPIGAIVGAIGGAIIIGGATYIVGQSLFKDGTGGKEEESKEANTPDELLENNGERKKNTKTVKGKKYVQSSKDGRWYTKDQAGHGGKKFKVYDKNGNWIADLDGKGNIIEGAHKGPVGISVPELR